MDSIVQRSGISQSELGLCVVSEGLVRFEKNKDQQMTPASLSKLLTGVAALKELSPEERFETRLYAQNKIKKGVLESPLYIKAGGDPSFVSESMWVLVNHFTRQGVTAVRGPIFIDASIFDENYQDSSRQSVRVDRAYDAPVSGTSFNWNSVNVYIRPTEKGEKALIIIDPQNDYFIVNNQVKTGSGSGADIQISLDFENKRERITVRGTVGVNAKEVVKYAAIQDPIGWVGANLISFLKQRNIQVLDAGIEKGTVPSGFEVMAESKGWSVLEIVDGMLKYSNNFIAEMLTKQLAAQNNVKKAGIRDGVQQIQKILKFYNLEPSNYIFESPSGFSNKNKITSCRFAQFLNAVSKDFSVAPSLMATLARPGGEGTLLKRIPGGEHFIRAKTGLLNGVVGLAGFASNAKGEVFSFVFMYNGKSSEEADARALFDKLALEVTKL